MIFFFSLFLGLSQPLLAWKEAMMVFSNFFNLFAIFLEFSITIRVGTHRNDFFFFFSLSWPFPTYFGLKRSYDGVLKFFEFFCYFFWNFLFRVGLKPIGMIIFIFSLFRHFPSYFGLKISYNGVFKFLEFFCYFFGIFYSGLGRNPSERLLLFSLFLGLFHPILAWKEAMMVFSNFLNFFLFFWNFLLRVG